MKPMKLARKHYNHAYELACDEFERAAIAVVEKHPKLGGFCAAMGDWFFMDNDNNSVPGFGPHNAGKREENAVEKFGDNYGAAFSDMFDNSFSPIRVHRQADGTLKVERDW